MPPFFQRKGVRVCRIIFRWLRISFLLLVLLAVCAIAYLHWVGMPDYLKRPLLRYVQDHGFEARFSNARLGWGPSIIIENAAFSRSHQTDGPRLSAGFTEWSLNWDALLHSRMKLDSLEVLDGKLNVPVSPTNGQALSLDDVRLNLSFFTNDLAVLNNCEAIFRGVHIRLDGEVTHFSALHGWRFPIGRNEKGQAHFQQSSRKFEDLLEEIHFSGAPQLSFQMTADGLDMNSLRAELNFSVPSARTPWGAVNKLNVRATSVPWLNSGAGPTLQAHVFAGGVDTRWAQSGRLTFDGTFFRRSDSNYDATVQVNLHRLRAAFPSPGGSNWFRSDRLSWDGQSVLASSNFLPFTASGKLKTIESTTRWGSARQVSLDLKAVRAPETFVPNATWGPWNKIGPYVLDWQADVLGLNSPKLDFRHAAFSGHWRAPQVAIENLQAELFGGQLNAGVILNINSREFHCSGVSDLDPHQVAPLLTAGARHFLNQFEWTSPPHINAHLRLVLPPWTNRPPDWRSNLHSSFQAAGDFTVGAAAFRQLPVTSADSHFTYTNRVWNVPHLHAVRPDGDAFMDYSGSEVNHEYRFLVDSQLDPRDAVSLLPAARRRLVDEVSFTEPPRLHAEIWGRWHDPQSTGFTATVQAAHFTAHGEKVDNLSAALAYTNQVLRVRDVQLAKDRGQLSAPMIDINFRSKVVQVTNADSTLESSILPRILGERCPKFLREMGFGIPPSVSLSGSFVMRDPLGTDLHFFIRGQRFHWTNLFADQIAGNVDWVGRTVTITNLKASLYRTGHLNGWMAFDYRPHRGSDFRSELAVRDIDLSAVAGRFSTKTNHLSGMLDGEIALEAPSTTAKQTWLGHGHLFVHNALLWDIRLFGILSPILDAIVPGSGDSRARQASASFVVTNNGISTDNLEIRSTGLRLLYRGTVDLDRQIDARVEADLLRDTPLVGPLLSLALTPLSKLFEYQISGSIRNPVIKPLYIPKFIMLLLRPFHTLKGLGNSQTPSLGPPLNAPKNTK